MQKKNEITNQNLKLTQSVILSEAKDLGDSSVAPLPQDDDVTINFAFCTLNFKLSYKGTDCRQKSIPNTFFLNLFWLSLFLFHNHRHFLSRLF